jgi:hypothetical protein
LYPFFGFQIKFDELAKSHFDRHPGEPWIMSGAGAGVQNILR